MKNLFVFAILIYCCPFICNADVIRIPQDFLTIQEGIDSAAVGDTVLVAPGTYTDTHETLWNGSHPVVCVSMRSGVVVMSEAGPDFTTISNDTAFAIIFIDGVEDTTSILKGFTIQGLYFGIVCINRSAPLLEENIIIPIIPGSAGPGLGLGIVDSSSIVIRNNIIRDHDLGINIEGACPRFKSNLFEFNNRGLQIESSSEFDSSTPIIHRNLFRNHTYAAVRSYTDEADILLSENAFENNGTAIYLSEGKALAIKNVLAHNQYGIQSSSEIILINNTIYGDSVGFRALPGLQQICNTIIWNNTTPIDTSFSSGSLVVNYSDIQGGWSGTGNIDADPLFVHPDTLNFQLEENSPCVNAAIDTIFSIQGDTIVIPDFQGSKPDMGAIESPWITSIITNGEEIPGQFILYANYPNPFNTSTTISYYITNPSMVVLKIYNMIGQEVNTLVSIHESPGRKSVIWDGKDNKGNKVASGIYLYQIQVENSIRTKKAVLVK